MLQEGDRVPDLEVEGFSTKDLAGKPYVLYFYPKDFTPGCTKEACGFRDRHGEIADAGAEIFGVSLDGKESHQGFAEKHRLNFPLVADPDRKLAAAFGVLRLWGLLPFTKRVTFVVDGEGTVRKVIQAELNIDKHIDEAIAALASLPSA